MPPLLHQPQHLIVSYAFFGTLYRQLFNPFSSPTSKLFLAPFYSTGNGGSTMFITCPGSGQVGYEEGFKPIFAWLQNPFSVTPVHAGGYFSVSVTWKKVGIFAFFFPPLGIQNRSMSPTLWFLDHFLLSDSVRRVAGQREASIFFFNMCFAFRRQNPFSGSHFLSKA